MSDTKPGRGSDQFPLRFPEGMRSYLKVRAAENGRSMNSEIISRLEGSMTMDKYYISMEHYKNLSRFEKSDPLQYSRSAVAELATEIERMMSALSHYKAQHMWNTEYAETDEDRELMAAIDRYIVNYIKEHNSLVSPEESEPLEGMSRREVINEVLRDWLIKEGFLERRPEIDIPF